LERSRLASLSLALVGPLGVNPRGPGLRGALALAWIAPEGAAAAATATNLERSRLASLSLALVGPLGVNPKRSIFGGPRLRCSLALACMT
jgi:hypothetical protein